MLKKLLIVVFSFSVFACTDSKKNDFITYCAGALNKYKAITKGECSCIYDSASKRLSEAEIDERISVPPGGDDYLATKEELFFLATGYASKCLKP